MNYKVLIEELLGNSIEFIWNELNNKEDRLNDVCLIAIQCLDRLEYIHSKNIVHKDIKPGNFLVGRKEPNLLYIIDFGMSCKYRSSRTGKHIKLKKVGKINGTIRYMSLNSCKECEYSRRDDLESLGYMLIELVKKDLPWNYIENEDINTKLKFIKMVSIKKSITPEELCEKIPNEFCQYLKYCRKLDFEQEPNYNYLRSLFIDVLNNRKKLNGLYPFDSMSFSWLKKNGSKKIKDETIFPKKVSSRFNSIIKRTNNVHRRLYVSIKKSIEKKKRESNASLITTDVKNITTNLNNLLDDDNAKNKNDEKVISITKDSKIKHKIHRNILLNINKNNKKQAINLKNEEAKKIQKISLIINNPKKMKLNGKIYNVKTTNNEKIVLSSKMNEKTTNIPNPKKDVIGHIRTDNNFNLLNINIPNEPHIKKNINLILGPNTNLQQAQNDNNKTITKVTSFNYQENPQFLYNKIQTRDSNFKGGKNINDNFNTNIHYSSIIERERKKRNPKIQNLSNIYVPNNFTIEHNVQNTYNLYFNKDLILNQNTFHTINKSNDIIAQTKELYYCRTDEFQ